MKKDFLFQCQRLSERFPHETQRERETDLACLSPFFIFILLATLLLIHWHLSLCFFCRPTHSLTLAECVFCFPFLFQMNHHQVAPTPVSHNLVSHFFLPQTAPLSIGECCMNQQYPANPSRSLLLLLSLSFHW